MNSSIDINKTKNEYDVLIVGGGIVGAGVLRELALNGISTLLVDKKDFSSQTSQASSKMLHGGIRYLENLDFALVFEALHEKNSWLKIAPHLCKEKKFLLPVYNNSLRPLWMIKIGLFLYDFLSGFHNSSHAIYSKEQSLKDLPTLKTVGLKGSGVYYDAVVDDAKLTLEVIMDSVIEDNCDAINYVSLISYKEMDNKKLECLIKDELTGETKTVICKDIVFAVGPFTDKLLGSFENFNWSPILLPSKGSHLWIKRESLNIKTPMVMTTKDGRVIFVIPHDHQILVGTTEKPVNGDYFDIKASDEEIDYLLDALKEFFPGENVARADILSTICGIRPLVSEGGPDRSKTSREHKIYHPKENIHVIAGGKYTTFRVMASDIVRTICNRNKYSYNSNRTLNSLRYMSATLPFENTVINEEVIDKIIENELIRTREDVLRRLNLPSKEHWNQKMSYDELIQIIDKKLAQ